ncbi:MAG: hypothetical protein ACYC6L_15240 [Anaerolineae bacterium]
MDKQLFRLSFWWPPENTYEAWKLVADCGFNVVPFRSRSREEGRQVLDWLQEFGILGMVEDRRIHPRIVEQPGWEDTVRQVAADYADHPALWGYFMADEPRLAGIPPLGKLTRAFHRVDPAHVAYSNLLPITCTGESLGVVNYDTYVQAYLEQVQPRLLSYDLYALHENDRDNPAYFQALQETRKWSLQAGIPFMNIFLSVPHFSYRDPSAEDLRWQVYSSLAYGAKGLTYFTYLTPDADNYRQGIIDVYGNPTVKYVPVQQLNHEISNLGPWLMRLTSTCVTHVGETAELYSRQVGSGSIVEADGGGRDLLVGEYIDTEKLPWVLVMNKDRKHSAWVTLRIRTQFTRIDEAARSTGHLREIARDSGAQAMALCEDGMVVRFWLAPADGRLMRLSAK